MIVIMHADKRIDTANNRISELEAKVSALMELLAVKEIQPETERKLKKGNKEVVIGKKPCSTGAITGMERASSVNLAEYQRRMNILDLC